MGTQQLVARFAHSTGNQIQYIMKAMVFLHMIKVKYSYYKTPKATHRLQFWIL
jgi:hypothetical protein